MAWKVETVESMRVKLKKYWNDVPEEHYLLASFFDPRTKGLLPENQDDDVFDALVESHIARYHGQDDSQKLSTSSGRPTAKAPGTRFLEAALSKRRGSTGRSVQDQLDNYKSTSTVHIHTDISDWWDDHAEVYPTLYRAARDINTIAATSVPGEQLFSGAKDVVTDKRNRIAPESMQACLCLESWNKLAKMIPFPKLTEEDMDDDVFEAVTHEKTHYFYNDDDYSTPDSDSASSFTDPESPDEEQTKGSSPSGLPPDEDF